MEFKKSKIFTQEIEKVIPGGAHTYSKGRDQFPENAPNGITHGKGAEVRDIDGNEFIDWGMGLTSVSLGHGNKEVVEAVYEEIKKGVNFMRPAQIELSAAKTFLDTFNGDMVKFAKHGSSVTTAAVKLSRAYTGKSKIAVAREHPFFSFDDWFIGSTEANWGVPKEIRDLTLQFSYNNIESLHKLFAENQNEISCVILEPVKFDPPTNNFLEEVRELCTKNSAVLIFDEMITGLKWSIPGAGAYLGVKADLYTWGKGIANGFSCVALTGKYEIMKLGGIDEIGQRKLFLLSTTHGAESTGLAAMLKTIEIFKRDNVTKHIWKIGDLLTRRLNQLFENTGLINNLKISGYPCLPFLETNNNAKEPDLSFRTLVFQQLISNGILTQGLFVPTPSHNQNMVEKTYSAFESLIPKYKMALKKGNVDKHLIGPPIKAVFRKYN